MILAISPHLDDVVFSCGGYLAQRRRPWHCVTVFTGSVSKPEGFALACQTDKGYGPEVDYMALRRAEDARSVQSLGGTYEHWPLREAPHRGYASAPLLFAGTLPGDGGTVDAIVERLLPLLQSGRFTEVLYPVGAGNHVDHEQVVAAVRRLRPAFPDLQFRQYFDQPYTNKFPERTPSRVGAEVIRLSPRTAARKWGACEGYGSQVKFQFGYVGAARVLGAVEWVV